MPRSTARAGEPIVLATWGFFASGRTWSRAYPNGFGKPSRGYLEEWADCLEPPRAVVEFVEKDRPLRWIFNYALACHGSLFSGKSGAIARQCGVSE